MMTAEVASSTMLFRSRYNGRKELQKISINLKILYYQNKFKQGVIDNFVESYLKGENQPLFNVIKQLN